MKIWNMRNKKWTPNIIDQFWDLPLFGIVTVICKTYFLGGKLLMKALEFGGELDSEEERDFHIAVEQMLSVNSFLWSNQS